MAIKRHHIVLAIVIPAVVLLQIWLVSLLLQSGRGVNFADSDIDRFASVDVADIPLDTKEGRWARAPKIGATSDKQGLLAILGSKGSQGGDLEDALGNVTGVQVPEVQGQGGGSGRLTPLGVGKRGVGGVHGRGRPAVQGALGTSLIHRVVREHRHQIQHCYERALLGDPGLAGKVELKFTVGPSGYVTAAAVSADGMPNPTVGRCLVERARTWRFPAPKGGGVVVVRYPFLFRSSPGGHPASRSDAPETEEEIADLPERFLPASGYFANTYLAGEPRLAWLKREIEQGIRLNGKVLHPEEAVASYLQPFDPPGTDGLAVYLTADRNALNGPARMILQVGLKGSARHARRRASLNAALAVDLREVPTEESRRVLWSLADAFASDLQAGDRFHLVVAGAERPLRLEPGHFDPGRVRAELARILEEVELAGARSDLKTALDAAFGAVRGDGSRRAPLGANLVILATAGEVADDLIPLVHRETVEGVTLSTIGVGAGADAEWLGELARTGQGRRCLVTGPKTARRVMGEELDASGRVVARAVRLRIRLAPGVRLVEVLGSRPLGEERTRRVRAVERSVDVRVSETMGIDADRGEDEDGIQMVIPAFYAGDDHAVLLDIVAPGPGRIADVRIRYKDLVNLRNGVARASLRLPAGERPPTPLTDNVQKNVLAFRLSADLQQAAVHLDATSASDARLSLTRARDRIDKLRREHPRFRDDPELARDVAMLATYLNVFTGTPAWQQDPGLRSRLSRSLAYAGRVKLPPGAPR